MRSGEAGGEFFDRAVGGEEVGAEMLGGGRGVGRGGEEVAVEGGDAGGERAEGGGNGVEFDLLEGWGVGGGGAVEHVVGAEEAEGEVLMVYVEDEVWGRGVRVGRTYLGIAFGFYLQVDGPELRDEVVDFG